MRWHLGRREPIVFAAIILFLELIYLVGDSGPLWLALGVVGPVAVLLGINLIVGARRGRGQSGGQDSQQ